MNTKYTLMILLHILMSYSFTVLGFRVTPEYQGMRSSIIQRSKVLKAQLQTNSILQVNSAEKNHLDVISDAVPREISNSIITIFKGIDSNKKFYAFFKGAYKTNVWGARGLV